MLVPEVDRHWAKDLLLAVGVCASTFSIIYVFLQIMTDASSEITFFTREILKVSHRFSYKASPERHRSCKNMR